MKAAIVCGSRDGGFTSVICNSFAKGLTVLGISSEVFFPIDMNISHCSGCDSCSESGVCEITDDMDIFYKIFAECDLLVLATPTHFSGPSSKIKTVIDRFQPAWFRRGKHPRFAAALISGGGKTPNFNNTISIFKAFSATAEMKWLGHLGIPNTDELELHDVSGPAFDYGKEIGLTLVNSL